MRRYNTVILYDGTVSAADTADLWRSPRIHKLTHAPRRFFSRACTPLNVKWQSLHGETFVGTSFGVWGAWGTSNSSSSSQSWLVPRFQLSVKINYSRLRKISVFINNPSGIARHKQTIGDIHCSTAAVSRPTEPSCVCSLAVLINNIKTFIIHCHAF